MASVLPSVPCSKFAIIMLIVLSIVLQSQAQLDDTDFNENQCSEVPDIIKETVEAFVRNDRNLAAYLIRLHFNDCYVGCCDASLLLNQTGERDAEVNGDLGTALAAIDAINNQIEPKCPQVVSCADILAMAARDASVAIGGPTWPVRRGRYDAKTAETKAAVESQFPNFNASLDQLKASYFQKNFTEREMVALAGRETIGKAKCANFRDRVNGLNLEEIDPEFAMQVRQNVPCPADGSGDQNLKSFDSDDLDIWDNSFYKTIVTRSALLDVDQALYSGSTSMIVDEYAMNQYSFESDFSDAMFKLSNSNLITNSEQGEIRRICTIPNQD